MLLLIFILYALLLRFLLLQQSFFFLLFLVQIYQCPRNSDFTKFNISTHFNSFFIRHPSTIVSSNIFIFYKDSSSACFTKFLISSFWFWFPNEAFISKNLQMIQLYIRDQTKPQKVSFLFF